MTLRLRVVDDLNSLLGLGPAWLRLANNTALTPFQSFAWNRAWWELVGSPGGGYRLHVVTAEDTRGVAAIAPLVIDRCDGLVTLKMLGDPYADYHDVLTRPDEACLALREIVGHLFDGLGTSWERIMLGEVAPASPLHEALNHRLATGHSASLARGSECPRMHLAGPALARALGKREYAVKERRLERLGRLECLYHRTPESVAARLPAYMQMHLDQWLPRPDRGITFDDPEIVRFYAGSVPALAEVGLLLLVELRLDDRPVAFYYGYTFAGVFWGYRPTFDTALARWSPGHVMHRLMFRDLAREGFQAFDFMRGSFEYKFLYASETRWNTCYTFRASS